MFYFMPKNRFEGNPINADCMLLIARKRKAFSTQSSMRMERKKENVPA